MSEDKGALTNQAEKDFSELPKDLEVFNQYMLAQLEAINQFVADTQSRVDQAIQLFITIASGAAGIFIISITSGQPTHIIIGALSLTVFALGAVGTATFVRVTRWQCQSERQTAIRNQIHRYFGGRNPDLFKYYKCGYNIYFFETSYWKRSMKDRPFLLAFGLGNSVLFASGIPLALVAVVMGSTTLSLSTNLWWIVCTAIILIFATIIVTYKEYNEIYTGTTDFQRFPDSVIQTRKAGKPISRRNRELNLTMS